jgi:hypothetical protein
MQEYRGTGSGGEGARDPNHRDRARGSPEPRSANMNPAVEQNEHQRHCHQPLHRPLRRGVQIRDDLHRNRSHNQQQRRRRTPHPLRHRWLITLNDAADVNTVRRDIIHLLERIESDHPGNLEQLRGQRWRRVPAISGALAPLGVESIYLDAHAGARRIIHLEMDSSAAAPNDLADWVGRFLSDAAADVTAKLAASGCSEQHAFIWATMIGTPFSATSWLRVDNSELPTRAPALPEGITHVWVASWSALTKTLAWSAEQGWWEAVRSPAARQRS